jgi:uncharacterized protein (DUF302 family)
MKTTLGALAIGLAASMASADSGIVSRSSPYPFTQTIERIESVIAAKGATVFARIDHSVEARKVGLEMLPATLLIFGNPKVGTPLMNLAPSLAIDLPLKVLVIQGKDGMVSVSFNSAEFLGTRHGLAEDQVKPLGAPAAFVEAALR